jgi:hypothetical protein
MAGRARNGSASACWSAASFVRGRRGGNRCLRAGAQSLVSSALVLEFGGVQHIPEKPSSSFRSCQFPIRAAVDHQSPDVFGPGRDRFATQLADRDFKQSDLPLRCIPALHLAPLELFRSGPGGFACCRSHAHGKRSLPLRTLAIRMLRIVCDVPFFLCSPPPFSDFMSIAIHAAPHIVLSHSRSR